MTAYADGDLVRIRDIGKPGHVRIPWYVRNKLGRIERYCGTYPNPEELSLGRPGLPPVPLFRVRLNQRDLWPDYAGAADDTLDIEVYAHWLAPAGARDPGTGGNETPHD